MEIVFAPFTVGDILPVTVQITASDLRAVQAASFSIYSRTTKQIIAQGACTVNVVAAPNPQTVPPTPALSTVSVPPLSWNQVDTYVIRFVLTWDNGEVDNQSSVVLAVNPPAT